MKVFVPQDPVNLKQGGVFCYTLAHEINLNARDAPRAFYDLLNTEYELGQSKEPDVDRYETHGDSTQVRQCIISLLTSGMKDGEDELSMVFSHLNVTEQRLAERTANANEPTEAATWDIYTPKVGNDWYRFTVGSKAVIERAEEGTEQSRLG